MEKRFVEQKIKTLKSNANNETRAAILKAIRQNLAMSQPFDAVHALHHAQQKSLPIDDFALASSNGLQKVSLIERFRENLISIGGNCAVINDLSEAWGLIETIIENKGAKRIAITDAPLIQKLKIKAEVLQNASAGELFECDLGITGAQWAIAETGTLVLESDQEFNRLTSLVPPIHVCILEAKNICQTLGEILEILERDLSRTVTFITGPSRTSDIELTLAIGVHGPAELHVIILEN